MIKTILKGYNVFAVLYIAFNVIASIDYLLPTKVHKEEIVWLEMGYQSYEFDKEKMWATVLFTNFKMHFNMSHATRLKDYNNAIVYATPLFDKPKSVDINFYTSDKNYTETFKQPFSNQTMYQYLIPFVALIFICYFFVANLLDHKLTFAITTIFLLITQLISFLS